MLNDIDFKLIYSTGEDEPSLFFLDALSQSIKLDLGLGFFSSSAINVLSIGFALFLYNGGSIRIIINDYLSEDDKEAILKGERLITDAEVEDEVLTNLRELFETLSNRDRHFFDCISYLIAKERIQIKAIVPAQSMLGISHQKFGIFSDSNNNKIAFTGSLNFSQMALFQNIESMSCYTSWGEDANDIKRITHLENTFENLWKGNSQIARLIPINKINEEISKRFPQKNIEDLLLLEKEVIQSAKSNYVSDVFNKKSLELINLIDTRTKPKPHFPSGFSPYDYQIKAFNNWLENGEIGYFEMATGTGKTITALNCALYLFNKFGKVRLLILAPTIPLINQWKEEVESFGFNNLIICNSLESQWTTKVLRELNKSLLIGSSFCIISTYATFNLPKFRSIISRIPEETLFIADEAHNLGSTRSLENLPYKLDRRIGLSATPQRHFDSEGTDSILQFFGSTDKITFKLGMKEAIDRGFLCRYYYYPKTVELTHNEMREYIKISKIILMYYDSRRGIFKECDQLERLLLKRKRIVNKAENKLIVFRECLNDLIMRNGKIHYTLVYVPEGKYNQFDNEDERLINEYSSVLSDEYNLKQHQFIGTTEDRVNVLTSFAKGEIDVLTAMKCLDEGIDVRRTENAIFCASTTNPRQFIQRRGRILRKHPEKRNASIYDIIVVPSMNNNDSGDCIEMERKLLLNELKRAYEFANIAENKLQALKSLESVAFKVDIDIFSPEII